MFFRRIRNRSFRLFVSIGAGFNQIPLIREAKRAGFTVIGIDKNPTAAGLLDCDLRIQEPIGNHREIYQKIQELLLDGEVKGVLTRSYGDAVRSTSLINEQIGRPYIPSTSVDSLLDKKKMKAVFQKCKIKTPAFYTVTSASQIKSYPCVMKPLKGHAKSGVQYIADSSAAEEYLKNSHVTDNDPFLCETFIKGDEIIASGLVVNGRFTLVEVTDKETSRLPHFADIRHSAPSGYHGRWDEIQDIGMKIAEGFGITSSPLLFEARIDESGTIFVIEAIPEFGGEFLADILIPEHTGYNFIRNAVLSLCGETCTLPNRKKYKGAVVVKYITATKKGILSSVSPLQKNIRKKILYSAIFKDVGSPVTPPASNHDRIGVIIAKGRTLEEANEAVMTAEKNLDIVIKDKRSK